MDRCVLPTDQTNETADTVIVGEGYFDLGQVYEVLADVFASDDELVKLVMMTVSGVGCCCPSKIWPVPEIQFDPTKKRPPGPYNHI